MEEKEYYKFAVIDLAVELYKQMPFWRKYRTFKALTTNNWDYTGNWEECLSNAKRMIDVGLSKINESGD